MATHRMSDSSRLAGVMTTAELAASGVSRGQLRRLVRRGAWLRLAHGVFAPAERVAAEAGDRAGEHAVRVAAALAVSGPGAVASHHSAALVHALDLLGRKLSETVALTRPPGINGCRSGGPGIRLHIAALPAGHVVTRRGLPVTSVARTVVDLARASSFQAGVVAADSALRSRQVSAADLELCVAATFSGVLTGRWGRPMERSSTPTRRARWPNSSAMPGCARRALRSFTSPGGRSPGRQTRSWPRSKQRSGEERPADKPAIRARALAAVRERAALREPA